MISTAGPTAEEGLQALFQRQSTKSVSSRRPILGGSDGGVDGSVKKGQNVNLLRSLQ